MSHRLLPMLLIVLWLAGCAGAPQHPQNPRQAVYGLSQRTAEELLAHPPWNRASQEIVLLVVPPEVDDSLEITPQRFHESLTRALLAQAGGPQVLDWSPDMERGTTPDNQWLVVSRLQATDPALRLSDRVLRPYRLELVLRRLGESSPAWQQQLTGALDVSAL
ncbi:hypothetical protein GCM10027040_14410 [Halomonas shantousis]